MTAQVRRATREDLNAFLELHAQVHALHLQHRPDQFKPTEDAAIEARFHEFLSSTTAKVWVAQLAGKVVGYAVEVQARKMENTWRAFESFGFIPKAIRFELKPSG